MITNVERRGTSLKIALVHDYLIDYGGAEEVLAALHELYPKAPIYVSILDKKGLGRFWDKFADTKIVTSWFNQLPFAKTLSSPLRFLFPFVWGSFDFSKYDVVITSASWAITKGMKRGSKTIEICYLHTPPRYLYGYDTSRVWKDKWYGVLVDAYALIVNHFMRMYDFEQAQKVDYFVANSKNVGKRIEKFYRRSDYEVIYPPVNVEKIINSKIKPVSGTYYLTGGRMVASKNFDLIIKAFNKLGLNLKIFGAGLEEKNLKNLAGKTVQFLGKISEDEKIAYLKGARAFVLAEKDEDFGITPIEAAAAGTPSIAYRGGGYLETIVDGKTGVFFDELTIDSLAGAVKRFNSLNRYTITAKNCVVQSKEFSKKRFKDEFKKFVALRRGPALSTRKENPV